MPQIDKKMFIPDRTDFINSKRDEAIVEILGAIDEFSDYCKRKEV